MIDRLRLAGLVHSGKVTAADNDAEADAYELLAKLTVPAEGSVALSAAASDFRKAARLARKAAGVAETLLAQAEK